MSTEARRTVERRDRTRTAEAKAEARRRREVRRSKYGTAPLSSQLLTRGVR